MRRGLFLLSNRQQKAVTKSFRQIFLTDEVLLFIAGNNLKLLSEIRGPLYVRSSYTIPINGGGMEKTFRCDCQGR
jgi:hypothetical protein